jgi:rhamnogalacturonyl hydrolase YesR
MIANHRRMKSAASEMQARSLLDDLISMQLDGYCGAAWGYNFDWQSRNFFAPRGTATIVPTAFAARALVEGARAFQVDEYLALARSCCDFILKDLPRPVSTDDQICFSYSPYSDTKIFNASLLAGEVLAEVGVMTGEEQLIDYAERAARYVVKHQRDDGSWTYGTDPKQDWVDNFHTAFVLFSLKRIIDACSLRAQFQPALERGYQYWKKSFFLADGWPKYYDDDPYPADAHAGASAIVTFLELGDIDPESTKLAENVARWTIANLRAKQGFFYYQKRKFYNVKKPYMRWSQAWMLYGLARLLEEGN